MTYTDTQAPLDGWPEGIWLVRGCEVWFKGFCAGNTVLHDNGTWGAFVHVGEKYVDLILDAPTEVAAIQAILKHAGINATAVRS